MAPGQAFGIPQNKKNIDRKAGENKDRPYFLQEITAKRRIVELDKTVFLILIINLIDHCRGLR
jgi:hypothetical protein